MVGGLIKVRSSASVIGRRRIHKRAVDGGGIEVQRASSSDNEI